MPYLALGTYEWQLCSALQRFTSCASAVSAIIEQHVLLCELKKKTKSGYIQKATSCLFHPGNAAAEMEVMKTETRPHIKCIRRARLSATEKADEAMLLFGGKKKNLCARFLAKMFSGCSR